MATQAKAVENQSKHLTQAERAARQTAEDSVKPKRAEVKLSKPKRWGSKPKGLDKQAEVYWKSIIKRMAGLDILDDLDSEMLGVYCSMLAELDALRSLLNERLAVGAELGKLFEQVTKREGLLHTYADKLGLTPQGRMRLALRRATAEADPDDALFGD